MGSKRLDDLFAYRRHEYRLQVQCAHCRRSKVYDPEILIAMCSQRGWSCQMLLLEGRFRCTECGKRNVRFGPVFGST